jgi:hypothetical protein
MTKQFGSEAARVSSEEMGAVFTELQGKVGNEFAGFELTLTLEEKKDHGDVDMLVLLHPDQNPAKIINSLKPLKYNKNGYCHSFLYESGIGKKVHVDFLVSSDPNLHRTKKQYYAFNDLSSTIGIVAKAYDFKYSSEGFFKRYEDKRRNWHDVFVSVDLNVGLRILGYEPKPLWLRTYQQVIDYCASSLLFDSKMFEFSLDSICSLSGRSKQHEIWQALAGMKKPATITDGDYFFKRAFPEAYKMVEDKKKEIEEKTYRESRFNGSWLMANFDLQPGPQLGKILKAISDEFGDFLGEVDEAVVTEFVKGILGK